MSAASTPKAANDIDISTLLPTEGVEKYDIDDRLSQELVIAFVGPIGSGVTTTYETINQRLIKEYGYDTVYIKFSSLIEEYASEVDTGVQLTESRVDRLQTVGNSLRSKFGEAYLADRAIERIAYEREERGGYREVDGRRVVMPTKRAYFLDSLKNPAELKRLRQVYGDLLWVVSVFAPENLRYIRLISSGLNDENARHAMKRDYEEEESSGQKVSKTAHQANYFIRNSSDLKDSLDEPVDRFLQTIFGLKLHTPTPAEKGMMAAASAAIRSACLSRQVGAAIYNANGDLLGVGCNDVPKFEGGLYNEGGSDNRCFHWKGKICHNDNRKRQLSETIVSSFDKLNVLDIPTIDKVMTLGVGNLIEFSRSVHAEMDAIVSIARSGAGSTIRSTLYTTTFPCHSCARHIVAAGITTVYYIEPYSKSLALELHSDSISLDENCNDKVRFLQYEGLSPKSSLRLFSSSERERKVNGRYVERSEDEVQPLFASPLDAYTTSENLIIQHLRPKGEGND